MAYSCVDRVNCSMKTIKSKKINEIIQCLIAFDVFIYKLAGDKITEMVFVEGGWGRE